MKYLIVLVIIISCSSNKSQIINENNGINYNNELFRNEAIHVAREYLEKRGEMFEYHHDPVKVTEEALHYYVYFKRKQNVRPQQIILKINKKNKNVEKVNNL